jgi:predicted permease
MRRNYPDPPEKLRNFLQQLLPRLQALPGVQAAAVGSALPLQGIGPNSEIAFGDSPAPPRGEWQNCPVISISPEYFRVEGTPLLRGREFSGEDNVDTPPVAVVNRAFARRYFDGPALGRQVKTNIGSTDGGKFTARTIVGVVQDVRYKGLTGTVLPVIYLPIEQVQQVNLDILLRTSVEPGSLSAAVRKAVTKSDPDQPLFDIETMEERMSQSVAQRRLMMVLIASFAVLALILAGIGVYGVFTYWVSQRRPEMGIRLAIGSSRPKLLRLIVMQAMRLILAGGAMGIAAAWFLDHLLAKMLVGVKLHDPVSLSLAWTLMTGIALLGSSLPALNAARTDLVSVLHSE